MGERQREGFTSKDLDFTKFRELTEDIISANAIDATSGRVLIHAFMNRAAFDLTVQTGLFHYYSREEKTIRQKGATSGNILQVVRIESDCDMDGVNVYVNRKDNGPACHTGAVSCFDVGPIIRFE